MPQRESLYTKKGLEKLAEIIKNFRSQHGISQRELARRCGGVSQPTIGRLESAVGYEPEDQTLALLATVLPYNLDELKAIAQEREIQPIRSSCHSAEEWVEFGSTLPPEEFIRGIQLALEKVKGFVEESVDSLSTDVPVKNHRS